MQYDDISITLTDERRTVQYVPGPEEIVGFGAKRSDHMFLMDFDGDWEKLVNNLKIGLAKSLAQECSLINFENLIFNLTLNVKFEHLNQDNYIEKLEDVLSDYFSKKIKVAILIGNDPKTPSKQKKIESSELKKTTESAIMDDSFVKKLIKDFDAEVIASSIEPTKKEN